jgi:glycosyltransferase involved in cell wall biosynthesis
MIYKKKSLIYCSKTNLPLKVSIITATYNSEKYLSDCIESVRKQTYGNIEHIIVDGKSTDNTLKIVKK